MGFQRKSYTLKWSDVEHPLHGLEIRLRGLSIGDLQIVTSLKAEEGEVASSGLDQVGPVIDLFAARLISWNYEDEEGAPIPPSREEIEGLDVTVLLPAIMQWAEAASAVSGPLKNGSPSGSAFPEASLPMEVL
jgi:hypothetical protein